MKSRLFAVFGLAVGTFGCSAPQVLAHPDHPASVAASPEAQPARVEPTVATDGPVSNGPWIGAAVASDALVAGPQDTFVAVWVDVPKAAQAAHAPADVALVIDTSGSMAGEKIANARKAAQKFVDGLSDGDIVSIHTFSDAAVERLPPTRLDRASRSRIASVVSELSPEGGTNLFEGVRTAGLAAMSAPSTHAVRRVVLISDGLATVGTTSREMLGVLGERAADHGVQITSVGVGLDYDEQTLNALALRSSGRLYHLERPDQLASIMSEEMSLLQATRATNAVVEIVPAPGVQLVTSEGARSTFDGGSIKVPLGAMFAGQHKEFLVRARVDVTGAGAHPIASVRLLFQDPSEGNLQRVQEAVARVDLVDDPAVAARRANAKAQGILAMVDASKATERAVAQLGADNFEDADRALGEAEKKLEAQAATATSAADKQRFEVSARRVAQARAGAGKAAAAPAAAKPAAKRAIMLDANEASMDMMGF